ncbi:TetR/AcrR family transcriptional regulator [Butyrivibrio sp. MB2005]|uniref:TetR/AcrR family transcriptional regulator n=1 Tax=Butyrivibrio sp. MB2005 TaxID=1280678 RepID=UPI0004260BC3|nr:TetR/AcrR family transcriptional regulator [Butyrivibrio sp. MB2005]
MSEKIKNYSLKSNTDTKKKEDGRIRYTKMRIRTAFYELLREIGYEKISVTAICSRAEINRATFYKHYLDVPDLVDKLQEAVIDEITAKLEAASYENIDEFVTNTLKYMRESMKDDLSLMSFMSQNGSEFSKKLVLLFYDHFSEALSVYADSAPDLNKEVLFAYISAGSAGVIDYWNKSGFAESEEQIAAKILKLAKMTLSGIQ